ncbi:hypothetical protein CDD83_9537 [Cordyceps sp. RAO-2017]|nr:hypothetical protein CDD83_9537 [Cordyceps sp. RAO-2017]
MFYTLQDNPGEPPAAGRIVTRWGGLPGPQASVPLSGGLAARHRNIDRERARPAHAVDRVAAGDTDGAPASSGPSLGDMASSAAGRHVACEVPAAPVVILAQSPPLRSGSDAPGPTTPRLRAPGPPLVIHESDGRPHIASGYIWQQLPLVLHLIAKDPCLYPEAHGQLHPSLARGAGATLRRHGCLLPHRSNCNASWRLVSGQERRTRQDSEIANGDLLCSGPGHKSVPSDLLGPTLRAAERSVDTCARPSAVATASSRPCAAPSITPNRNWMDLGSCRVSATPGQTHV